MHGLLKSLMGFIFSLYITAFATAAPLHPDCPKQKNSPNLCALDFKLPRLDGSDFNLSQLRGKVILLHFWATWCKPCEAEMPYLVELAKALKDYPVEIVAVSLDNRADLVSSFFARLKPAHKLPPFTLLLDAKQEVSGSYGSLKVPESFIIDPQGRIVDSIIGTYDWSNSIILHYLQALAKKP